MFGVRQRPSGSLRSLIDMEPTPRSQTAKIVLFGRANARATHPPVNRVSGPPTGFLATSNKVTITHLLSVLRRRGTTVCAVNGSGSAESRVSGVGCGGLTLGRFVRDLGPPACPRLRHRCGQPTGAAAALARSYWDRTRFARAPARLEALIAQSCGEHRRYGDPPGAIRASGSGKVVARERHRHAATRARVVHAVPRVLAAAPAGNTHVMDLVSGLGIPAHAARIAVFAGEFFCTRWNSPTRSPTVVHRPQDVVVGVVEPAIPSFRHLICTFGRLRPRAGKPLVATVAGVNPVRRAMRSLNDRFPRTFTAISLVAFAAFVVWDIVRAWDSPIRGSTVWVEGTLVGLIFGVTAAVGWVVAVGCNPGPAKDFVWWQWLSCGLWLVALATAHQNGSRQPSVTNGYVVGALWYEIAAFLGAAVTLAMVIGRQIVRRRRIHRCRPLERSVRRPGRRSKSDTRPAQAWRNRQGSGRTDPNPQSVSEIKLSRRHRTCDMN